MHVETVSNPPQVTSYFTNRSIFFKEHNDFLLKQSYVLSCYVFGWERVGEHSLQNSSPLRPATPHLTIAFIGGGNGEAGGGGLSLPLFLWVVARVTLFCRSYKLHLQRSAQVSIVTIPPKRTIISSFMASSKRSYQLIESETTERMNGEAG